MAFTIRDTTKEHFQTAASIYIACHVNDEIWAPMTKDILPEDHLAWITERYELQSSLPCKKVYEVFEISTGKMVAYATLFIPWTFTEEEKAAEAAKPQPPLPVGMNETLFKDFMTMVSSSAEFGYDPEKHFHRKGTMVLPEYQRKGLGTMLSLHCNKIADEAGAKTFVGSRPNSVRMLKKTGFEILAEQKVDLSNFGGRKDEKAWVMCRRGRVIEKLVDDDREAQKKEELATL